MSAPTHPSSAPAEPLGRRERKAQQAHDHIAATAWAMFEAQGFDNVTMEAVAAAADVAKGTLYKYFPTKEALMRPGLQAHFAAQMPQVKQALARLPTAGARLQAFMQGWSQAASTQRPYVAAYVRLRLAEMGDLTSPTPAQQLGLDKVLLALIEAAQAGGDLRRDMPAAVLAKQLQSLMLVATLRWLAQPALQLGDEIAHAHALFTQGAGVQR